MSEPLRGKIDVDDFGGKSAIIDRDDVASAVRFFEKYVDDKEGLMSEETEAFLVWIHLHDEGDFKTQQELDDSYRKWFFRYCFEDVIE